MTDEEREREFANMNPELVLQNLADFMQGLDFTNSQFKQMADRFCPLEAFFAFKAEVKKDEERKEAMNDVNLQLRTVFERLESLDNSRRNLQNDQQSLLSDIRLKENRTRVDALETGLNEFASKTDVMRVKSQFEQYTTLVSFNKVRMEQEEINKQTKMMEKIMVIKSEL